METVKIWSNKNGWIGICRPPKKKRFYIVIGEHECSGEPIAQFIHGDALSSGAKARWFQRHLEKMMKADGKKNGRAL